MENLVWFPRPKNLPGMQKNIGKIYAKEERPIVHPKLHDFCRCFVEMMEAVLAGDGTKQGINGADWWLKNRKRLPDYYITVEDAKKAGWVAGAGNLAEAAPGKMIYGGRYYNRNRHLPYAPGRIWSEADINYEEGWRGMERIVFSNDGLLFVSYDHYNSFYEIL